MGTCHRLHSLANAHGQVEWYGLFALRGGMIAMDLSGVLTSAAVSAVVSGLFTFVSQHLERRARRGNS
jgi:hypothetical protein